MIYPMIDPSPERTPTAIETIEHQPHDEQQLRQRLLQLIVKSEAKRRSAALKPQAPLKPGVAHRITPASARSLRNKLAPKGAVKKRA